MNAILTFDLEFWYNRRFLSKYLSGKEGQTDDYTKESIELLLDLLKKHNQKATFFVLGQLAEKYPDIIKKISDAGHEIASHGYSHKTLEELGKESFEKEIKLSKSILKKITGKDPKGFRAPNFSLNKKTGWALDILKKYDFEYDSSVHPLKFFKVSNQIKEFYPCLGGNYFRKIPLWLYVFYLKYLVKNKPPILYFHPYEFFKHAPQIKSGLWWKKGAVYWGTKNAWKKFEKLCCLLTSSKIN